MKRYLLTFTLMAVLTMLVACATPEPTKPAPTVAPTKAVEPTQPAPTVAPTKAAEPTKPAATTAPVSKFNEAPMLAEQVKAGKLPPVEQRLPKNPVVVPTVEKIGRYGGTWRVGLSGGNDQVGLYRMVGYEGLVRWDPSFKEIIPNLAESFQANADASEYTFKLREGLKWSNGKPFTANDILFWYEDILLNKDLTPTIPTWLTVNDKPVVVEKINDYTVKFKFAGPYGLFLQRLGHPDGTRLTAYPAEYLKQFLPKYNPNADKQAKDAGLKTWVDLFNAKIGAGERSAGYYANLELPRLIAWIPITSYDGKATQVTLERNPYYWKVDAQGNQLPYIDRVQATIAGDVQALVLKALNGEIDMQDRHIATLANKAVFADGMQKGNYRFYELIPSQSSTFVIMLNMTHKDPVKRAVFQNKDFRIGLSYAINRKEIIDTVYVGQGKPFQAAPRPESPFYNERLATQYTEYDVKKANEALDKAGLTKRDAEGFRLMPDGRRVSFTIESIPTFPDWNDSLQLIQKYWKAVGVDMQIKVEDRALLWQRVQGNENDAVVWEGAGGYEVLLDPRYYFPVFFDQPSFGVLWAYWYAKDKRGEEPPAPAKRQMELYDQINATADPKKQEALMKELLEITADQFYAIGISLTPSGYGIVKNNMRNVPKSFLHTWTYASPAGVNPCQFFFEQP